MSKKEHINQIARKIILKKGYESFRLDDLLEALNLSKGGFYHYYKSVDLLLEDLIREDFANDMDIVDKAGTNPSVKSAIVEIIQSVSSHQDADTGILQALSSDKSLKLYLTLMEAAWYQPFKNKLRHLLSRGVEHSEFDGIDVFTVCELFEAINRHANRSEILTLWGQDESKRFHVTALRLLAIELDMETEIRQLIDGE